MGAQLKPERGDRVILRHAVAAQEHLPKVELGGTGVVGATIDRGKRVPVDRGDRAAGNALARLVHFAEGALRLAFQGFMGVVAVVRVAAFAVFGLQ